MRETKQNKPAKAYKNEVGGRAGAGSPCQSCLVEANQEVTNLDTNIKKEESHINT